MPITKMKLRMQIQEVKKKMNSLLSILYDICYTGL